MKLYSYTVRVDDGAAPNPFGGVCTLTICKPPIRRGAEKGDWIVGFGPSRAPDGSDYSKRVIYAMRVSDTMCYEDYDRFCQTSLKAKIPDWREVAPFEHQVGDCIYEALPSGGVRQRRGVHVAENFNTDVGGKRALLAEEMFYYFGKEAVPIPEKFESICHPNQGYKVHVNNGIKEDVAAWLERGLDKDYRPRILYGRPLHGHLIRPGTETASWQACGGQRIGDEEPGCIC